MVPEAEPTIPLISVGMISEQIIQGIGPNPVKKTAL